MPSTATNEVALEAEIVQGFHADETLGVLVKQVAEGFAADVADEVVEGFGDGQGSLVSGCQVVEVVEDGALQVAQVVIRRAAAAQPQAEKERAPPSQEAAVVFDQRLEARVGQLVEPVSGVGKEVAGCFEESPQQAYDLPRLSRFAATWVLMRARDSWVIW